MFQTIFRNRPRAATLAATSWVALAVLGGPALLTAGVSDRVETARAEAVADPTRGTVPAVTERAQPQTNRDYRISPGDVLGIEVWKEPDASNPSITVRLDGKISVPMLGDTNVAGLTPAELETRLTSRFGELIRDAHVTVTVREANSQKIYLIGEVKKEGPVKMQSPMTVLQALAEAGGVTDFAKRRKIYILRTEQAKRLILPFNYDAVVHGEKMEQNILLSPGDTIIVPR